jgi:hypothetical protein
MKKRAPIRFEDKTLSAITGVEQKPKQCAGARFFEQSK